MNSDLRSLYGLDVRQVRDYVVVPACGELGLLTPVSAVLTLGTGMTESELRFLDQVDRANEPGPAYGLFQMEHATHDDLWRNFLEYRIELRAKLMLHVPLSRMSDDGIPDATWMQTNLIYAAMMCRIHYRRVPAALPPLNATEMAMYWKAHYNTPLGKGTVVKAIPHFQRAITLGAGL